MSLLSLCFSLYDVSPSADPFVSEADNERPTHIHVQLARHVTALKARIQDFPSCCVTDSHSCQRLSLTKPSFFVSDLVLVSVQQESMCSLEGISSHSHQRHGTVTFALCISASFAFLHCTPPPTPHQPTATLISILSLSLPLLFGQVTAFRERRTNRTPTLLTYVSRAIFHQKAL